jgi:hypothetical protein
MPNMRHKKIRAVIYRYERGGLKILLTYQDGIEVVKSARVFFMEPFNKEFEAPGEKQLAVYKRMLPEIKAAAMLQYGRNLKTDGARWSKYFKCLMLTEERGFDIFIEMPGFRQWHEKGLRDIVS